jgi:DNA polymerase-1
MGWKLETPSRYHGGSYCWIQASIPIPGPPVPCATESRNDTYHRTDWKRKSQISFDLVDTGKACVYAAEDAWAVWQLYPIYRRKIDFSPMANLYDNIELPLIRVLQKMEENGVAIDTSILSDISHLINLELKKLIDAIYQYAGYEFNLNSTQQLAKLLFEEKGLPNRKKTKTGFSMTTACCRAF